MAKSKERRNEETGLVQKSIWLHEDDIEKLRDIGKRADVDREWSYLVRRAMREFIERDEAAKRSKR